MAIENDRNCNLQGGDLCYQFDNPSRKDLLANTKIGFWTLWFLIAVGVFGASAFLFNIIDFEDNVREAGWLATIYDALAGLLFFVLSLAVIVAFKKREADAVFLGKTFLILTLASILFTLYLGDLNGENIVDTLLALICQSLWLLYLFKSKNIEEICPRSYRVVYNRDAYFITFLVAFMLIGLAVVMKWNEYFTDNMPAIELSTIHDDEETDGYLAFKTPGFMDCERIEKPREDSEEMDVTFVLTKDSSIYCEIEMFEYENNDDKEFDSYIDILKPNYVYQDRPLNKFVGEFDSGNLYRQAIFIYPNTMEEESAWRVCCIYDGQSKKMCLIMSEDNTPNLKFGENNYIEKIGETVRFR